MSPLAVEQLHAFHKKDRDVFSKLVLFFSRPLGESLLVMATWFWLENLGFEDIFSTILALEDPFIEILANEAVLCYQCLGTDKLPPHDLNQVPLTAKLMRKDISLHIIYKMKYSTIVGIRNFLNTICSRVFSDIIQRVLPCSSSSCSSSSFFSFPHPLIIPGFPHPTFGNIIVMHDVVDWDNLFFFPNGLWRWNTRCIATQNERTLFITFSRGFPVTKAEVKQLFTEKYGDDSVEDVYIPYNNNNNNVSSPNKIYACSNGEQQPLWGRVVLYYVVDVDRVLDGQKVRKFQINGKQIWARKYSEKKEARN